MSKPLRKVEQRIIELFADHPNYTLHRCNEHGVFAHMKDGTQKTVCPRCHKHCVEQTKEKLLQ